MQGVNRDPEEPIEAPSGTQNYRLDGQYLREQPPVQYPNQVATDNLLPQPPFMVQGVQLQHQTAGILFGGSQSFSAAGHPEPALPVVVPLIDQAPLDHHNMTFYGPPDPFLSPPLGELPRQSNPPREPNNTAAARPNDFLELGSHLMGQVSEANYPTLATPYPPVQCATDLESFGDGLMSPLLSGLPPVGYNPDGVDPPVAASTPTNPPSLLASSPSRGAQGPAPLPPEIRFSHYGEEDPEKTHRDPDDERDKKRKIDIAIAGGACEPCSKAKIRCDGAEVCARCIRKSLRCTRPRNHRRRHSIGPVAWRTDTQPPQYPPERRQPRSPRSRRGNGFTPLCPPASVRPTTARHLAGTAHSLPAPATDFSPFPTTDFSSTPNDKGAAPASTRTRGTTADSHYDNSTYGDRGVEQSTDISSHIDQKLDEDKEMMAHDSSFTLLR